MNVSLPAELKQYVDERASCGSYGSNSEYLRELIRHDQARENLREMLLEGARSPIAARADKQFFADMRQRLGIGEVADGGDEQAQSATESRRHVE